MTADPMPLQYSKMTPEQAQGFDTALDLIEIWATQVGISAKKNPPSRVMVPMDKQLQNSANFTVELVRTARSNAQRT